MRQRGFEKVSYLQWEKDVYSTYTGSRAIIDPLILNPIIEGYEKIKLPKRATSHSAGYDVFSPFEFILKPNEDIKIPTGWKSYMMEDEKIIFHPRSGLGFKYYLRLANTTGVGDSDYYNNKGNEGHYWIKIRNEGNSELHIQEGDAIAQCIFEKYLLVDGDSFEGKERSGGLGSTSSDNS